MTANNDESLGGASSQSLSGRHFLVTGANAGLGRVTAEVLAKRGGTVTLAGRSKEKMQPVLDGILAAGGKASFLSLDLGSFSAIRASAEEFLARGEPLHVLVNNAGLAGSKGLTKDGFELAIGTNHLGPFLFTNLLLPRLRDSTPARIVNVASGSHYDAKALPFERFRDRTWSTTGLPEYAISKLCNVLFTQSLARGKAGEGITSYSLHPGTVATNIWRALPFFVQPVVKLFMKTVEDGASTQIYCATSPDCANENGLYYTDSKVKKPSALAQDKELADKLWAKSAELVSLK